jgi:hypothetical protein
MRGRTADNNKADARKIVSKRLRTFITMMMSQFTATSAELLTRAESRSADAPTCSKIR